MSTFREDHTKIRNQNKFIKVIILSATIVHARSYQLQRRLKRSIIYSSSNAVN